MNRTIALVVLLVSTMGLFAENQSKTKKPAVANSTNQVEITGMTCDGCAKGLTSELRRTPGVASASVTFSNKLAIVSYDTNQISQQSLLTAIKEAGFGGTVKP